DRLDAVARTVAAALVAAALVLLDALLGPGLVAGDRAGDRVFRLRDVAVATRAVDPHRDVAVLRVVLRGVGVRVGLLAGGRRLPHALLARAGLALSGALDGGRLVDRRRAGGGGVALRDRARGTGA